MTNYPPRKAVLVTPPSIEPVILADVKLFLRVDGSEEDSLLTFLTTVARELAEKYIGNVLITQNWQLSQVFVEGQDIFLIPNPIQSVTKVAVEYNSVRTVLSSESYELSIDGLLKINELVSADTIIVDVVSGYGAAEDVPAPIKEGILQTISYLYHNREQTAQACPEAKSLWEQYCEIRI